MLNQKIAEIIQELKKVREENGLSYQKIVDLVAQNGEAVSLSTVKKVFDDGSESYGYQYENTIKPIADAVLGIYSTKSTEASATEADAMKAIIDYKSEKIIELQAALARCEESYKRRIDFLKGQIALKDERIDRRDALIERKDALIERLINELLGVERMEVKNEKWL